MVVNFWRLNGVVFYELTHDEVMDCVRNANTSEDLSVMLEQVDHIPESVSEKFTDRQARLWFKRVFPWAEVINKVDKHFHTEWRDKDGDKFGD